MSYFGNKLKELLDKKKFNQSEFAKVTGLSQAYISKLINGEQTWVSADNLENICTNISTDQMDRARLIAAHLQDECNGPGSDLIKITVNKEPMVLSDANSPYKTSLPAKFAHHLQILSRHAEDKQLRTVIEGLAQLFERDDLNP